MINFLLALSMQWIENTIVGTPNGSARTAIFVGESHLFDAATSVPGVIAPDTWTVVRWNVPEDVTSLDLAGELVTGSEAPNGKAFIGVSFRPLGSGMVGENYSSGFYTNRVGDRLPVARRVPVTQGLTEIYIHREPGCEWIVNLQIDHYYRGGVVPPMPPMPPPVSAHLTADGLQVTVTNGPGNTRDWIGIYPQASAANPNAYLRPWAYLTGSQTPPTLGLANATVTLPRPVAGAYVVRVLANDGFSVIGEATVTVP